MATVPGLGSITCNSICRGSVWGIRNLARSTVQRVFTARCFLCWAGHTLTWATPGYSRPRWMYPRRRGTWYCSRHFFPTRRCRMPGSETASSYRSMRRSAHQVVINFFATLRPDAWLHLLCGSLSQRYEAGCHERRLIGPKKQLGGSRADRGERLLAATFLPFVGHPSMTAMGTMLATTTGRSGVA